MGSEIPRFGRAYSESSQKTLSVEGGGRREVDVYTIAMRDIFDRNDEQKYLRFFATGKGYTEELSSSWIAQQKKSMSIPSNTLFSGKRSSQQQKLIELDLLEYCDPMTVSQRTGDWFLMKSGKLTGTMAGKIASIDDFEEYTLDAIQELFAECQESWYGRHSSNQAMKQGSVNEIPTVDAVCMKPFVLEFYEVGLLQWKTAPYLGVSPDGVLKIIVPSEDDAMMACVEIKTRVSANTIDDAVTARENYGEIVHCTYGDDIFNGCVPSNNAKQILHQALVTNFEYGVFVTAKVEEEEGSLVQIVVVRIPVELKLAHAEKLLTIGEVLLRWRYLDEVITKGYLEEADFPGWMTMLQKETERTRFQLWSAHYKKIKGADGKFTPTYPVLVYKHAYQYKYNKGKGGVDKATKMSHYVGDSNSIKLTMEGKYMYQGADGVVGNHWKEEQVQTIVNPFVMQYREENNGENPSAKQIGARLQEVMAEDHTYQLGIDLLNDYETNRRQWEYNPTCTAVTGGNELTESEQDLEIQEIIERRKRKKNWPIKRDKLKQFDSDMELKKIRCYSSQTIMHIPVIIPQNYLNAGKRIQLQCALCGIGKVTRKTSFMCNICEVPLCTKLLKGEDHRAQTHFIKWHTAQNLKRESLRCNQKVGKFAAATKNDDNDNNDYNSEVEDEEDNESEEESESEEDSD